MVSVRVARASFPTRVGLRLPGEDARNDGQQRVFERGSKPDHRQLTFGSWKQ